jgi:hypothetical protein
MYWRPTIVNTDIIPSPLDNLHRQLIYKPLSTC